METWMKEQIKFIERKRHLGMTDFANEVKAMENRIKMRKNIPIKESNKLAAVFEYCSLPNDAKTTLATALVEGTVKPVAAAKSFSLEDLANVQMPGEDEVLQDSLLEKTPQKHEFFYNYLTKADWDFAAAKAVGKQLTPALLASLIYRAAARIGFCRIEQNEYSKLVGIFGVLGSGAPISGKLGLETVNELKKKFASMRKGFPKKVEMVMIYPEDPSSLPEPWLSMSNTCGALIKCPFDVSLLQLHQASTPNRSTHWSIKSQNPKKTPLLALADAPTVPNLVLPGSAASGAAEGGMDYVAVAQAAVQVLLQQHRLQLPPPASAAAAEVEAAVRVFLQQPLRQQQQQRQQQQPPSTVQVEEVTDMTESPNRSAAAVPPRDSDMPGDEEREPAAAANAQHSRAIAVVQRPAAAEESAAALATSSFLTSKAQGKMGLSDIMGGTQDMLKKKSEGPKKKSEVPSLAADDIGEEEQKEEKAKGAAASLTAKAKAKTTGQAKAKAKTAGQAKAKAKTAASGAAADSAAAGEHPKEKKSLVFPGTRARCTIHYGKCTIYSDLNNKLWRLKPQQGTKKLSHWSWKREGPAEVWRKLVQEVTRLNR